MIGPYDDIIDLPHPTSERHPRMPMSSRAAQFSAFRALTGYEDAVEETARLTDSKVELTEDEKTLLDAKLRKLTDCINSRSLVTLTYFQPDKKKDGGAYVSVTGQLRKIDNVAGVLILTGGECVPIEDVLELQLH